MTGYYFEDYINDYSQSFNTLRDYTHYSVSFPNENINIGYSGNYALVVYEENEYEPSFMARFYVYERKTSIVMTEGFSKNPSLYNTVQRVTFTIDCHNNILREPYNSLTVVIQQNNKPFLAQYAFAPKYITGTSYVYDYDDKYEFIRYYFYKDLSGKVIYSWQNKILKGKKSMPSKKENANPITYFPDGLYILGNN